MVRCFIYILSYLIKLVLSSHISPPFSLYSLLIKYILTIGFPPSNPPSDPHTHTLFPISSPPLFPIKN